MEKFMLEEYMELVQSDEEDVIVKKIYFFIGVAVKNDHAHFFQTEGENILRKNHIQKYEYHW